MPRRTFRFIDWRIEDDPAEPAGEYWATCTTCRKTSDMGGSIEPLDDWVRRHAARTGHDRFRYASLTHQRAVIVGEPPTVTWAPQSPAPSGLHDGAGTASPLFDGGRTL